MAHGGRREGAGRKAGAATERTRAIADKAAAAGLTPLDVMLDNMAFYHRGAEEALTKLLAGQVVADSAVDAESVEDAIQQNIVEGMKQVLLLRQAAGDAAKDAAPFIHARLSPDVGEGGGADDESVPLAERLKAYAKEDAMAAEPNKIVELKARR